MSARDALSNALWDNYTRAQKDEFIDAFAHELAEQQRHHVRQQGQNPLHYGSAHWAMIGVDEAADLIDPLKGTPR